MAVSILRSWERRLGYVLNRALSSSEASSGEKGPCVWGLAKDFVPGLWATGGGGLGGSDGGGCEMVLRGRVGCKAL